MVEYTRNPSLVSLLLSEGVSGECHLLVIVRKHIREYTDEQYWQMVPPETAAAGRET